MFCFSKCQLYHLKKVRIHTVIYICCMFINVENLHFCWKTKTKGYYGQVVIGNVSTFLGKNAESTKAHKWTCYVKGVSFGCLALCFKYRCRRERQNATSVFFVLIHAYKTYLGLNDVDISKWVSNVVFELHSSFDPPSRGIFFCFLFCIKSVLIFASFLRAALCACSGQQAAVSSDRTRLGRV